MRKQFCLKRFEECSACADMSCSSLSLTLSEVAAIPKLRMVWWFVHAITCAMAVGSCTVAEARWSIAFRCFNLRTGENVEGDFTMKQQAGGWRTLQLDFFKIILWHDCVECSYSVQISCPGVPSSFVPRRTTNPGRARFELIKSCWEKMRQVLFSWCEFMWWFQLEQVEVEIEVPAETMESVAIEVSWSHLVLESYCKRRGSTLGWCGFGMEKRRCSKRPKSTQAGTQAAEEHSLVEVQRAPLWLCGIPNKDRPWIQTFAQCSHICMFSKGLEHFFWWIAIPHAGVCYLAFCIGHLGSSK